MKEKKEEIAYKVNKILTWQREYKRLWRKLRRNEVYIVSKTGVDDTLRKIPSYCFEPRFSQLEELRNIVETVLSRIREISSDMAHQVEEKERTLNREVLERHDKLKAQAKEFVGNIGAWLFWSAYLAFPAAMICGFITKGGYETRITLVLAIIVSFIPLVGQAAVLGYLLEHFKGQVLISLFRGFLVVLLITSLFFIIPFLIKGAKEARLNKVRLLKRDITILNDYIQGKKLEA